MFTFKDLDIQPFYRSNNSNIGMDFFNLLIKNSKIYRRAVGFFSSSSMVDVAEGLYEIARKKGKIELIVSPKLSEKDIDAINEGYRNRNEVIVERMLEDFYEVKTESERQKLSLLTKLISIGVLDIKVAILVENDKVGIYHEKIGYFEDFAGNKVAFNGSSNDSITAYRFNFESITVFKDWEEKSRVNYIVDAFDKLWDNRTNMISTIDFPKAVKEKLFEYNDDINLETGLILRTKEKEIPTVNEKKLRDYQKRAIKNWFEAGFRGIFDMATGTGKTITALGATVKLLQYRKNRLATIVVVPYIHLAEQWAETAEKFFNIDFIVGHSSSKYHSRLKSNILDYVAKRIDYFFFVTTNASFKSKRVQEILSQLNDEVLFIADEAHNLGTQMILGLLSPKYRYRLALSATFERFGDEEGTEGLINYFGEKCIEYPLKKAIREGMLTRYEYYPHLVILNDEEREKYEELTAKIAASMSKNKNGEISYTNFGKKIILERARLIAGAQGKLNVLFEEIKKYKKEYNILVYCGTSKVNDEDDDEIRQIDYVTTVLGNKMDFKVQQYTSRENITERRKIKERFERGDDLQILAAIKCLDEGVDIPSIKTAFILASSTNPREYIQRRGRVLRLHKNKSYSVIHDFIVIPYPVGSRLSEEKIGVFKNLLKNEITRLEEFGKDAENSALAYDTRMKLLNEYNFLKFDSIEEEVVNWEE
ncbi:MAG: DEAD/DEAH box helicase family protein [Acholeplasmatales bacterium]